MESLLTKTRSFILAIFILTSLLACKNSSTSPVISKKQAFVQLSGSTMATTYHITVSTAHAAALQSEIDTLLKEVNDEVNTYWDHSLISQFNRSEKGLQLENQVAAAGSRQRHFLMNYYKSKSIASLTQGYFDPTIMPLVSYWGFGREKKKVENADPKEIEKRLEWVGMEKVHLDETTRFLHKDSPDVQLDFSAIAKGYAVDVICELLDRKRKENYYVEIGGELRTKGKSPRNQSWIIGISKPDANAEVEDFELKVKVSDIAVASSGNYRIFYEVAGKKYGHTIDPKTGYPKMTNLLSTSIFAEDCITADAFATACMAMNVQEALQMIENTESVEGLFIYAQEDGSMATQLSSGMEQYLLPTTTVH